MNPAGSLLPIAELLFASLGVILGEIFIFNVLKYRPLGDNGARFGEHWATRPYRQANEIQEFIPTPQSKDRNS